MVMVQERFADSHLSQIPFHKINESIILNLSKGRIRPMIMKHTNKLLFSRISTL